MIDNLHQIKGMGLETGKHLEAGKRDMPGELSHAHRELKKKRSSRMSDPFIDGCAEIALRYGATGGKLVGAGGGGFLTFYCRNQDQPKLAETPQAKGFRWERFLFDFEDAKILVNA
ncbi:MAG: hypothetical protein NTX46_05625 [Chloroflexi bacterium]|nr:hypothetical protein [Chloroflexota bacterium]